MSKILGKDAETNETYTKFLNGLTELGLELEFTNEQNPGQGLWSIELHDKRLHHISTNGKGASSEAARASALGEMVERFLNQTFFEDYYLGQTVANAKTARYLDEIWVPYPQITQNSSKSIYGKQDSIPLDEIAHSCFCDISQQIADSYENDFATINLNTILPKEIIDGTNNLFPEITFLEGVNGSLPPMPKQLFYPEFNEDLTIKGCRPFTDIVTSNTKRGICAIPLTLENGNQTAYFPVRYLESSYCSNGMCAGNTPYEAKVQGLSEICERFVRRFLFGQITPNMHPELAAVTNRRLPLIPLEYLKSNCSKVIDYITLFKNKGISIECFDASLGGVFPVALVLATKDEETKSFYQTKPYKISIGAHPNISIALERCFTELMQGLNWDTLEFHTSVYEQIEEELELISFNLQNHYQPREIENNWQINALTSLDKNHNFIQDYIDDSGEICSTFFNKNSIFNFCDWSYNNHSTKEEYEFLLNIFTKLGKKVWCYDASYRDLYAYRLIVPNFSEIYFMESPEFASECRNVGLINTFMQERSLPKKNIWHLLCREIRAHYSSFMPLCKQFGLLTEKENPLLLFTEQYFMLDEEESMSPYNQENISFTTGYPLNNKQIDEKCNNRYTPTKAQFPLKKWELLDANERKEYFECLAVILAHTMSEKQKNICIKHLNKKLWKALSTIHKEQKILEFMPTMNLDFEDFPPQKTLQKIYLEMMKKRESYKTNATSSN